MENITPKTNIELFGHEAAEALFMRDFSGGKLAHGWLISGPQGIGKATLAYRFTRTLLASDEASARRIAAGSHADLLVIEPEWDAKKEEYAREITVEQAREITRFLSLTPGEGQWRMVIVDSVDALNTNAANAILKILEEPPPQAVLLLVSHNPGKLLPTIRSRCRNLKLMPLTREEFIRVVRHVAPETERLEELGQLSGYAPGIALAMAEQGAIGMYEQMLDLLAPFPEIDPGKLHAFADQVSGGTVHANWQMLMRLMLCLFERAAKTAAGERLEPVSDQESQVLARMAGLHPAAVWAAKWQQAMDQFLLAERRHLDYKQVLITFFHDIPRWDGVQTGNAA